MNTKHISLAFVAVAVAALFAGCGKSPIDEPIDGQFADLELSYVGATGTKAAIDGTRFPTDGEIGLFLFEDEQAAKAYGTGYENVKYSYNSTKSKWTASPSVKVGSTPGYLYGYYPYSSTATDIKAIPVSSSLNGDDVMYATKQEAITDKTASQTSITMNHALARVSVKVINNGYTGEAKLSQIKFEGAKIASSGKLNALDGKITATKADEVVLSVPTAEQTIATGDGTTYECLLVPSEINSNRQDVTLSLTIDGEDKSVTLSGNNGVIFAQGTQSNITISLSNTGIAVRTVSVEDWKVVEVGGFKVNVEVDGIDLIENDILIWAYPDGDAAKIKAFSISGRGLFCTVTGNATCNASETDKVFAFTISEINSDVTATIGYKHVEGITLDRTSVNPAQGWLVHLSAGIIPEDAGNKTVIWSSNNPTVATVDDAGNVTAVAQGTATITATAAGGSGVTATCTVKVGPAIPGSLSHEYSVSATRKVHFSRGNLYYDGAVWGFESEQYYFRTYKNFGKSDADGYNDASGTADGHCGLFGWSTSEDGTATINNYGMITSTSAGDYRGNFFDWGKSIDDNDTWSTLTGGMNGEWKYLLDHHATTRGTCNSVPGRFIAPDGFVGGGNALVDAIQDWEKAEAAGIIFLPFAGNRFGPSVMNVGQGGYYWSSSPNNNDYAYRLYFYDSYITSDSYDSRQYGHAVRLVIDCE